MEIFCFSKRMKILLVVFLLSLATFVRNEECQPTACSCYEDFEQLEYQCPNSESDHKIVIHKGLEEIIVECWNIETPDIFLPNISFSSPNLRVSDCSISLRTAVEFHVEKVVQLKIENSNFEPLYNLHFLSLPMRKLEKLSLKGIKLNTNIKFGGIKAPNLSSLELEDVDFDLGLKIFKNRSRLVQLSLSFNNIVRLHHDVFRNLTQLEHLHLSTNNIKELHDDLFKNLSNLKSLNLDFNEIKSLNNQTFKDLKQLISLDLSSNNIEELNRSVLSPLQSLKYINLDHNEALLLDNFLLANFSKLQYVFLGHCNLRHVPENLFVGSNNIFRISLENNFLEYIPETLFKGLVKLEVLNLHNNVIKRLHSNTFKTLVSLEILELHHNQINTIDSDVFKPLEKLVELQLHNNEIAYISNDSFRQNSRLEKIFLSDNKYVYEIKHGHFFAVSPFSSCLGLKELDLSNNYVKDVMEDLFVYLKHLKILNLRNNSIETVDVASLWKIAQRGIVLNLENNNINHFFFDESLVPIEEDLNEEMEHRMYAEDSIVLISNNPLNCDCYAETFLQLIRTKITSKNPGLLFKYEELSCNKPLILNGIKFSKVSPKDLVCPLGVDASCASTNSCHCFWQPYERSIIVDCAKKNLSTIPHILVSSSYEFEHIVVHLEGNFLKEAPMFENGYNNVTKLYLSNNQISNLTWIPENIEVLEISFNKFEEINDEMLVKLNASSIKNLTLGHNPWTCDCGVDNLAKYLRKNVKKIDVANVKCQENDVLLADLTTDDICKNNYVIYLVSTVVACIILGIIFITLAIYYKYTHEIKVWLYARNICTSRLLEEELDKNKKYDVFISFSHKDEDFVMYTLLPELEKEPMPYKVCIHLRDWIAGDFIVENIALSVTNSKRTLVVLTPNFLESVWGKIEFRTAHAEAMKEKRNRVILVVKDDIDVDSLDDELKTYMRTNTYIKWNDAWFWEKLKYALPHKRSKHIETC